MKTLITGGMGFIGSNFVRFYATKHPEKQIVILDNLTYAGHPISLKDLFGDEILDNPDYLKTGNLEFIKGDIIDPEVVERAMQDVDTVVHFAAESHVDRSVIDPLLFIKTNVLGTATLLNQALKNKVERFHHISTDEVFGDLEINEDPFTEETAYDPRSPYAASKASSDMIVRAYFKTFGLPITISNTGNNYGPFHDPEKLIPRFITNLLTGQKVPLFGKGENIRSWVHVLDHCSAIDLILEKGALGETYCVGGIEWTNAQITKFILKELDMGEEYIEHVPERLGHDFRYGLDSTKVQKLGWQPQYNLESGLTDTIEWFKQNEWWWKPLLVDRPNVDREAQRDYKSK